MPRKAKPSPNGPLKKEHLTDLDIDTPLLPQVHLRRSSRGLSRTMQPEDIAHSTPGNMLGIRPEDGEDINSKEMDELKDQTKEEMQLAIEGLARMERRLRGATKRQKLQIEEEARFSKSRGAAIETSPEAGAMILKQKELTPQPKRPTSPNGAPPDCRQSTVAICHCPGKAG
jgi:UV DNA damage endonuclease